MKEKQRKSLLVLIALAAIVLPSCGTGYTGFGGDSAGPEPVEGGTRFSLYAPRVEKVSIAGDFNGWSPGADPLFDREGTGMWTIVLPLGPGRYAYKYVIDGEKWVPDPGNPEREKDGFGGYNSVVVVGP